MIGSIIADSAKISVNYIQRLLVDVKPEQFARFATVNGQVIESNHPAFILGHLSLYPCRIVAEAGHDASAIDPSEKFEALFSPSATCLDDPDGTLYPSMDEITGKFFAAHEAVIQMLPDVDDSVFHEANANEKMVSKFGTKGSMHAFYLGGHVMMHVGQFSAWRRATGLGSA